MYARVKKSGKYQYLQIVKSRREGKKVTQQVITTIGRMDRLSTSGEVESLVRSLEFTVAVKSRFVAQRSAGHYKQVLRTVRFRVTLCFVPDKFQGVTASADLFYLEVCCQLLNGEAVVIKVQPEDSICVSLVNRGSFERNGRN